MSIEKTFNDFIKLHEKKIVTDDVTVLENSILDLVNKSTSIIGEDENELKEAVNKLSEGMDMFRKVLVKYELYDITSK